MVHSTGIDGRITQIERPMCGQGHGKLTGCKYLQEDIQWSWMYESLHKFYTVQNLPVSWFSFTTVEDWYTKVRKSFWNWNISSSKYFELDLPVCNWEKKSCPTWLRAFQAHHVFSIWNLPHNFTGMNGKDLRGPK